MIRYNNKVVSKLTLEQVKLLRDTRPETGRMEWYREQGKRYGVHPGTIMINCNGGAWGRSG